MPIIKAAVKHLRQSEKHRKANRLFKEKLKTAIKDIIKLAKDKNKSEYEKRLPEVVSLIDKAAKKNLLHKNNAARKKSALSRFLKA